MQEVASEAVVDNSGHDFEGGFEEGDRTRVGQRLVPRLLRDKDKESSEKLCWEGGPSETVIAERGVGNDGVTRADAEEPGG
jgi:hypothetical protein